MTTMRVAVQPQLLTWACRRAGKQPADLAAAFPKIAQWLDGSVQPTLKQLERFAKRTYTPIGFLFLPEPPEEGVPIPDMRTLGSVELTHPSPNLLDTVYLCQQRQSWYRSYAQTYGLGSRPFVGSLDASTPVETAAMAIRTTLDLDLNAQFAASSWEDAFRAVVSAADQAGILVMINGIVGVNTHRTLDPQEFRGFALSDDLAPLVFVNGADAKAAQMFTLAHELAHLWLGETALSDAAVGTTRARERWCNAVAAEFLVPADQLAAELNVEAEPMAEARRLSRVFRVSTLVLLRRFHDIGHLSRAQMGELYRAEVAGFQRSKASGGGDFYRTQRVRVGKRFARAVIESTWEGRSSFTEANQLLNVKKKKTMLRLAAEVGLEVA